VRMARGQDVTPAFEGWIANPDGTFTLYFGYMNRNYEEELDIPIGPNNNICFAPDGVDSTLGVSRPIESRCDLCFKLKIASCLNWCAIV
ncbi:MAG TPA: hypothetical protein VIX37_19200, partial [Candidatus Sulfotelmatobacter sp.]